jgi:integrase
METPREKRHSGPKPRSGPTDRVAKLMRKGACLIAHGKPGREVSESLGVSEPSVRYWQQRWSSHWQALVDAATEAVLQLVRAEAGTNKVLENPDAYMRPAQFADRWAGQKGIELFPALDGEMTLSKFYSTWYLPNRLHDARARSKEGYVSATRQWKLLTGDPPVKAITTDTIVRFRDALSKMRGRKSDLPMSANSIRTYMRHVQILLDKLGPPGRGNRDGLGILERVPWAKPPREVEGVPQIIPLEQFSDCIRATVVMKVPKVPGIKPPTWWRALLLVAWNTALRVGTLLTMRMDEIDWQNQRLVLPAGRMKSRRPMIVHLNGAAMEALQSIRTDRELVFPWQSAQYGRTFYRHFHELQTAAGIPEKNQFGMHAIRKTVATLLWEASPAAAQFALGHTSNDVTKRCYVDGGALVARALDKLPQPEAFVTA